MDDTVANGINWGRNDFGLLNDNTQKGDHVWKMQRGYYNIQEYRILHICTIVVELIGDQTL